MPGKIVRDGVRNSVRAMVRLVPVLVLPMMLLVLRKLASARLAVVAVVVVAFARHAGADEGTRERDVQSLIADAVVEYDAGRFEEARALFRRAHHQSPSARTLRGIGMASFEMRDYVDAIRTLAASLAERRRALTPEQRRHVEGLLARTEAFVGRFTPRLNPPNAALLVDGQPAEREPDGTLLLSFGPHRLAARSPGHADAERDIQVLGGEKQDLVMTLDMVAARGSALTPAPDGAAMLSAPGASDGPPRRAPWLVGGAAVLAAGGALAAGLWWHDRAGEVDACRAAGSRCQNEASVERERNTAAGITIGLAAAAVTTGIVATVLWSRRGSSAPTKSLACLPVEKGVSCAMAF